MRSSLPRPGHELLPDFSALVLQERQGQIGSFDLAKPAFGVSLLASKHQVGLDLGRSSIFGSICSIGQRDGQCLSQSSCGPGPEDDRETSSSVSASASGEVRGCRYRFPCGTRCS